VKELTRRRFAVPIFAPGRVAWWALVAALLWGAAQVWGGLGIGVIDFPAAAVTGLLLGALVWLAWWLLLRIPQLWGRVARSASWTAALWGALVAAGAYALPANGAMITLLAQHVSVDLAQAWGAAIAAPLTEETGKALAILAVVLVARERLRTPMDAALLAGFAGLGFTVTEDILYGFNIAYLSFGEDPVASTLIVFFMRAVLFASVSVVFSALVGAGVGFWITDRGRLRFPVGLALVVAGPLLHMLWNSPLLVALPARLAFLVAVPLLVWAAIRLVRGAEHRWFERTLAAPGALGRIPVTYVDAVKRSWWKRRSYRNDVARTFGSQALAAQRRLEAELTDLADAVAAGDQGAAAQLRQGLEARLAPPPPGTL